MDYIISIGLILSVIAIIGFYHYRMSKTVTEIETIKRVFEEFLTRAKLDCETLKAATELKVKEIVDKIKNA